MSHVGALHGVGTHELNENQLTTTSGQGAFDDKPIRRCLNDQRTPSNILTEHGTHEIYEIVLDFNPRAHRPRRGLHRAQRMLTADTRAQQEPAQRHELSNREIATSSTEPTEDLCVLFVRAIHYSQISPRLECVSAQSCFATFVRFPSVRLPR